MAKENEFFDGLRGALEEGVDALRKGKVLTVREVHLPPRPKPMGPKEIVRLRKRKLGVSQRVFARLANTAPQTIHAWEQGRAKPSGSALRVLHIFDDRPDIAKELLSR
jgi:DNA-binding transcriptional regulator YiaG